MSTNTNRPEFLNRFTTLPFVLDILTRKKLTLLNPSKWEDYNDRLTLELFKQRQGYESVYALCLSDNRETIHHWNAFANGSSGCCIEFYQKKLLDILDKNEGVKYGKTTYLKVADLDKKKFNDDMLPFVKRHLFEPEQEFRIIFLSQEPQKETFDIEIELDSIKRITVSNKMPKLIYRSVRKSLINTPHNFQGEIYRSTLFDNRNWTNFFNELKIPPSPALLCVPPKN